MKIIFAYIHELGSIQVSNSNLSIQTITSDSRTLTIEMSIHEVFHILAVLFMWVTVSHHRRQCQRMPKFLIQIQLKRGSTKINFPHKPHYQWVATDYYLICIGLKQIQIDIILIIFVFEILPSQILSLININVIILRFGGDKGGKALKIKFGVTIMNTPLSNSVDAFDSLAAL